MVNVIYIYICVFVLWIAHCYSHGWLMVIMSWGRCIQTKFGHTIGGGLLLGLPH
jgi:hypothetical protein